MREVLGYLTSWGLLVIDLISLHLIKNSRSTPGLPSDIIVSLATQDASSALKARGIELFQYSEEMMSAKM